MFEEQSSELESALIKSQLSGNLLKVKEILDPLGENDELIHSETKATINPLSFSLTPCHYSPIQLAAALGDNVQIDLLVKKGASLHNKNQEGMSPLLIAVACGQKSTVDHLLTYYGNQVSLKERNIHGFNPIACALYAGQVNMANHLLKYYADQLDLGACTNKAFKEVYQNIGNIAEHKVKSIYSNTEYTQTYEDGYTLSEVVNLSQSRIAFNLKEKLLEKINTATSQSDDTDIIEQLEALSLDVSNTVETENLTQSASQFLTFEQVEPQERLSLSDASDLLSNFDEFAKFLKAATKLSALVKSNELDKARIKIDKMPSEIIIKFLHCPSFCDFIIKAMSPDTKQILLKFVIKNQKIDDLIYIIKNKLFTQEEIEQLYFSEFLMEGSSDDSEMAHSPEDTSSAPAELHFNESQKMIVLAMAINQGFEQEGVVIHKLDEFLPMLKKRLELEGHNVNPSRWIIIRALMNMRLIAGDGPVSQNNFVVNPSEYLDPTEITTHTNSPYVFLQLLKLADTNADKLMVLKRYAELITGKGMGMHGIYSNCNTPFNLLCEMFGTEQVLKHSTQKLVFDSWHLHADNFIAKKSPLKLHLNEQASTSSKENIDSEGMHIDDDHANKVDKKL